ncbi:hypothetical protein SAMN05518849_11881 [Sphingobium sp. AP50]|uniref:hypothetical protein n=1 Tax=Sphingobium sp. AP50 TaxID=1884369 RepID=UPI0008D4BAEE|nr:hypothetical protein [Sphingobium sp. AP50]SEJ92277.1 hypothetical protein SAMN05518849_11881 [Sphingobium sp. AP50]
MNGIFSSSPSTGPARLMIGGFLQAILACVLLLAAPDPSFAMLRVLAGTMLLTAIGAFACATRAQSTNLPPYGRQYDG